MFMKVNQKVILSFSIVFIVFSLAIFLIAYNRITGMVNENFRNYIEAKGELGYETMDQKYPGDWRILNGQMFKGDILINNNFKIADEMSKATGGLVTIFQHDIRITTTVTVKDGARAIGTRASGEVVEQVLKKGKVFLGDTLVVGNHVTTYYKPLTDPQGNVIGMWFVGIEKTRINQDINNIMAGMALLLLFMTACGISIAGIFGSSIIKALAENEERYRTIFDNAADPIIVYDMKQNIVAVNAVACNLFDSTEAEMLASSFDSVLRQDWRSDTRGGIVQLREGKYALIQAIHKKKDGTDIYIEVNTRQIKWNGKPAVLGICRNITERRKAEDEILYLSYHDQLTGLYNRRFYEEELSRIDTGRNLPLSIIMGDLNGLKLVNDSFGHSKGDELLKKAAKVIRDACRADDIIARLGGDEFVVLLPGTDAAEAEKIIRRIKQAVSLKQDDGIGLSISFGYDTKNSEAESIQEVFKKAEDRMYKRKLFESQSIRGRAIHNIIENLYRKNEGEEKHSKAVSALCEKTGIALGLPEGEIIELKKAGLFHDIGKIAVDTDLKRHPEIGYRILSTAHDMGEAAESVLAHHERWDGKGYPRGLKEKEIPFSARIVAIANAYDDMTGDYRSSSPLTSAEAAESLQKDAGGKFDPELVSTFIRKVLRQDPDMI
jgi:diguanylate cyclase (GGDEF)-like protein/PAS domain S-box-containing protein